LAKEDSQFRMEGEVVEVLPNAMFRVLVDGQQTPVMGVI
jgi:translation initiation factor IF-1